MDHSSHARRLAASARRLLALLALPILLLTSCHDDSGPTAPPSGSTATLQGTVVLGSGSAVAGLQTRGGIALGGVTVRVSGTDRSTSTDGSGSFTLTGVPVGAVELEFERADIHARAQITLAAGTHSMTFSIVGSRAIASPQGHAGEEIDGLVQALDAGAGTLTVLDQRLGAVRIVTDGDTVVRRGDAAVALSDIQVGVRVHVKALAQDDGTYLATEIVLQDQNVGGMREVSGTVSSVDANAGSFVVDAGTSITIDTDARTDFKKRGGPASFADVTAGASVEVKGILQANGHVLAHTVRIES